MRPRCRRLCGVRSAKRGLQNASKMTMFTLLLMVMITGQAANAAPVVGYAATWLVMRVVGKPDGYPRSHIAVYDEQDVTCLNMDRHIDDPQVT